MSRHAVLVHLEHLERAGEFQLHCSQSFVSAQTATDRDRVAHGLFNLALHVQPIADLQRFHNPHSVAARIACAENGGPRQNE